MRSQDSNENDVSGNCHGVAEEEKGVANESSLNLVNLINEIRQPIELKETGSISSTKVSSHAEESDVVMESPTNEQTSAVDSPQAPPTGSQAPPPSSDAVQSHRLLLEIDTLVSTRSHQRSELDLGTVPDLEDISSKELERERLAWQLANSATPQKVVEIDSELEGID